MGKLTYGPDFICIGAQKSGTSWLYRNLNFHPQTVMPYQKEINFFYPPAKSSKKLRQKWFAYHLLRNKNVIGRKPGENRSYLKWYYHRFLWYYRYIYKARDMREYHKLFPKWDNKLTGDISPSYAYLAEEHISALANVMPNMKIIYLLRNPIDRAWSQFRMYRSQLALECNDDAAIFNSLKQNMHVCDFSFYHERIKLWEKYFNGHIKIWFYDQLCEDAPGLFAEICDYIGLKGSPNLDQCKVDAKVFEGPDLKMPQSVRYYLQDVFHEEITNLHARFANQYTKNWLDSYLITPR